MNQTKLWTDPAVVAERREPAETFLGRPMEMPGHRYNAAEQRMAAAHLAHVARVGAGAGELAEAKAS